MHYSFGRARLIFNFSLHLYAVPPRNFPPSFLPSLGSISGYHVVHSPACQTTLTMTSSVIHRENGYTSYTCHSLAHMPSPLSRTLRVNKDLHLADEVNADELCRLAAQVCWSEFSKCRHICEARLGRLQPMQKMIARIPHSVKSLTSTLSLVKWPQCASSIILDCLIPKFTVTLFLRSVD